MSFPPSSNLEKAGVKEIKFYYKNDPIVGNIYTACVFVGDKKELLSRGVSICSVSDSHNKSIGRKLAEKRAKRALLSKKNNDVINIEEPDDENCKVDLVAFSSYSTRSTTSVYRKTFRTKNEEQFKKLIGDLEDFGYEFEIKKFNDRNVVNVWIPYYIPVFATFEEFKFKSEFKPTPTDNERMIFKMDC